jgi:D-tyrosyl-tRNA(Tyr) deacylase
MRAVIQRVSSAAVRVEGDPVSAIGTGLAVLLGVADGDTPADAKYLAAKIARLRIFEDRGGKMNLSLLEVGGEALVVSQFTLCSDCSKGRRPSFVGAASPDVAEEMYRLFGGELSALGVPVRWGRFGERMEVVIHNQGPVTLVLDTSER